MVAENIQQLARNICQKEGKKVNLPISQVQEVLLCLAKTINEDPLHYIKLLCLYAHRIQKLDKTPLPKT